MATCVYFGEETGRKNEKGQAVHACQLHEECVPSDGDATVASCDGCSRRLSIEDKGWPDDWEDPLLVMDRRRRKTDCLRDLLAGGSAFLVCGGPSADAQLELLNRRGIFSLAINNASGHPKHRPQAMLCADPPMKFTHSVWLDPGVMKFIPSPKMKGKRARVRTKIDGVFGRSDRDLSRCPNVWAFQRESWLTPDDRFFLTEGASWGNHDSGTKRTGEAKTVCTMLLGLRMLRYLGAKRIYLVGVDFRMAPDYGYSFPQGRTEGASYSNNRQFAVVNQWLCEMERRGVFHRFGVAVYNTFERSGLRAFPYVPIGEAVEEAVGIIEREPDLQGWYEKASCPKCGSWSVRFGERCECTEAECGLTWDPSDPPDFKKKKGKKK